MSRSVLRFLPVWAYDLLGRGIDPFVIWSLARYHFPAARLWAAANGSGGDIGAMAATLPDRAARRLLSRLGRKAFRTVIAEQAAHGEAVAAWRRAAIDGDGDPAAAETSRRRAASRHLATQAGLLGAVGRKGLPLVDFRMAPPDAAPPDPTVFDAPSALGGVTAGPVYREGDLMRQWLAAPSEAEAEDDQAYARVTWPADATVRGVVVAGAGVGVEWDLYVRIREDQDLPANFCPHSLAIVELVSPGHGLRGRHGRYGGELFFAGAPVASAAMLAAQTREAARWIAWARERFGRPVGIFGVSMSSFAAQLVLTHSANWPEAARPDGGFLVAHSDDLVGVVTGKLAGALGIADALKGAGWTPSDLTAWRDALRPGDAPAAPAARIVSMLGRHDSVTPFPDGYALGDRWGLPEANRFVAPHGHMGLPLRLLMDPKPIERFADVLASAR